MLNWQRAALLGAVLLGGRVYAQDGLYIVAEVSVRDAQRSYEMEYRGMHKKCAESGTLADNEYMLRYDVTCVRNPYMRVGVGVQKTIEEVFVVYAEAFHKSSVATGRDRGENAITLGIRIYLPL